MDEFAIHAEVRSEHGKGATRRLRRTGKVPGVLYGAGEQPVSLQVDANTLRKQVENEAFFSHILSVEVGTEKSQAIVKAMQRAPASGEVTHFDLQRVRRDTELTMNVPLHIVNEESCVGRKAGGVVNPLAVEVEISCLPAALPEYIEVDVENLDIGDSVQLSQLVLPEGVRLATEVDEEHDHPVVNVTEPQRLDMGDEEEAEAADEDLGEEPPGEAPAAPEGPEET